MDFQLRLQVLKQRYNLLLAEKTELEKLRYLMPCVDTVHLVTKGKGLVEFLGADDVPDDYKEVVRRMVWLLDNIVPFELDEALFGFIATDEDKELLRVLKVHGLDALGNYSDLISTIKAMKSMRSNFPKIDVADVDVFAEGFARKLIEELPDGVSVKDRVEWKRNLKTAVIEISLGVVASGLYELITYFCTEVAKFDGGEGDVVSDEELRKSAYIRHELTIGLSLEDNKNFECLVDFLRMSVGKRFFLELSMTINGSKAIKGVDWLGETEKKITCWKIRDAVVGFLTEYAIQRI